MVEEEITAKEEVKKDILKMKAVDYGILEAYLEMPQSFREALKFDIFWSFHRKRIEEEVANLKEMDDDLEDYEDSQVEETIPPDELCKKCKKYRHSWRNPNLCLACQQEVKEAGFKRGLEIKEELLKDQHFWVITNATSAVAYAKKKFAEEEKDKSIPLYSIAREAYALKKA